MKLVLFLLAVTLALWYSERSLPADYLAWSDIAVKFVGLVTAAYFLILLLLTYLEYRVYTYMFTEEAFLMTSGIATRDEVAALYHQIQNVNIARSPLDRMVGVSQVVILMTGAGGQDGGHTKIILPAVGKTKAKAVQKELLVRARKHVPRQN